MKFGIYVRSSLSGTARELELERQADHCHGIVQSRRGELSVELREPSAANGPTLPALKRLIEQARAGAFQALVVESWERLGRDRLDARRIVAELESLGVSVCAGVDMPALDHDAAQAAVTTCCGRIGQATDDLVGRLVASGVAESVATQIAQDLVSDQGVENARRRLRDHADAHGQGSE